MRTAGRGCRPFVAATALTLLGLTGATRAVAAEPPGAVVLERHVVKLYDADVVLDLSAADGAKDGAVVELWRPLTLKHPVTGADISDKFLIGRLRLTQVRATLSLARPLGTLGRGPEPGDVVVLRGAVPAASKPAAGASVGVASLPIAPSGAAAGTTTPPPPAAVAGTRPPGTTPHDPDAEEIGLVLDAVRGKGIKARILAYEAYVRKHPEGRYVVVLWEEAQKLRQLLALEAKIGAETPVLLSFQQPATALAARPLSFGVELDVATGAVLHARSPNEALYTSTPMQRAGDGYFTATLAPARVSAPGIEYFIEAVGPSGEATAVLGGAGTPERVPVVDAPQAEPPPRHASVANVWTDYANWNAGHDNDVVWQTEGYVGMRFRDQGMRAARTGFGVYRGRGGSLSDLDDQHLEGRTVGLTYGYLEGEYGLSHFTGLIGRGVVGLQKSGVSGGMQLHLRLGNDQSTNLTLGGEVLGTVGLRGIVELTLATFPKVPIVLRTEITNQPAGTTAHGDEAGAPGTSNGKGDVGARAIAQVGYRFLPSLTVSIRGSYQGRTINHAGPGVGGGIAYQW